MWVGVCRGWGGGHGLVNDVGWSNIHTHPFKSTFRGFGTERARLGTFRGFGTERANLGN